MRPRLLEIEGLQSFKDNQRIDFDTLGEAGLFGIFGPTGSGKSTVLDAITFALYGRVKRAERGTQGIINSGMNAMKVSFTFELRKGDSVRTYRVERTYQRRKASENSCEPRVARLVEITQAGEIPVCDKASEVNAGIEELLGLNHDDFTRAVVIPQNSFQEFLLLDNAKKRDMLERIFYLEEYGKELLEKLNSKLAALKSRLDVLTGELSGYADASAEALASSERSLNEALGERSRVEKEYRLLEAKHREALEVWQLVQEMSQAADREQNSEASRGIIEAERRMLERALKAENLIGMIDKMAELSAVLSETQDQLSGVLVDIPAASSDLDVMKNKYDSLKSEMSKEQPALIGLKTKLTQALAVKAEMESIQAEVNEKRALYAGQLELSAQKAAEVKDIGSELEKLATDLARLGLELQELLVEPEYRQRIQEAVKLETELAALVESGKRSVQRIAALDEAAAGLETGLKEINEEISALTKEADEITGRKNRLPELTPEYRNSVANGRENLLSVRAVYEVVKLRNAELGLLEEKASKQAVLIKTLEEKVSGLEAGRAEAENRAAGIKAGFDAITQETDKNIACLLSRNLMTGMPCPVCGSLEHPSPAAPEGGKDVELLAKQREQVLDELARAESLLKEAEREVTTSNGQLKALKDQMCQVMAEVEVKKTALEAEKQRLPESMRSLTQEALEAEITRMETEAAAGRKAFEAAEKEHQELGDRQQAVNSRLTNQRLKENAILTELKVSRENRKELENTLLETDKAIFDKRKLYGDYLQDLEPGSASKEMARLSEMDRRAGELQRSIKQSDQMLDERKKRHERLNSELGKLSENAVRLKAEAEGLQRSLDEKRSKLHELTGNPSNEPAGNPANEEADNSIIEDKIRLADVKLDNYTRMEREYGASLKELENRLGLLQTRKTTLESQRDIYVISLHKEEALLEASLHEKGFASRDEVRNSIVSKEKQNLMKVRIEEFDRNSLNIKAQKEIISKKLGNRSITEAEWRRIESEWQEMTVYKEKTVSDSEVAKSVYDTLKAKHTRWLELDRDFKLYTSKYGLLDQIQKLLKAGHGKDNSFIDYIAEERLRYIATKASETLGCMTKYKYSLELDANAGFIIRDNANGGIHRPVTSLSGGETFLTSLSLALALSEQIQLKGQSPLEFFFLDEGFGTLDPELLDSVMDSLEKLSRSDRVIGLISHVPELRNRLSRRLVVEPPTVYGGGSRVRIEKA